MWELPQLRKGVYLFTCVGVDRRISAHHDSLYRYKGFKGNCATSFIDQFKVLHQCNKFCEILGLKSLQPKAKKPSCTLKSKPQPSAAPKKKTFGPSAKGKS